MTHGAAFGSLFENLSSIWRNYRRRNATIAEIENLTQRDFESLAADFGFEPGDFLTLYSKGEGVSDVLDFRLKQFGISSEALNFAALGEMQLRCIRCASKRICKRISKGKNDDVWPSDCPNFKSFKTLGDEASKMLISAEKIKVIH